MFYYYCFQFFASNTFFYIIIFIILRFPCKTWLGVSSYFPRVLYRQQSVYVGTFLYTLSNSNRPLRQCNSSAVLTRNFLYFMQFLLKIFQITIKRRNKCLREIKRERSRKKIESCYFCVCSLRFVWLSNEFYIWFICSATIVNTLNLILFLSFNVLHFFYYYLLLLFSLKSLKWSRTNNVKEILLHEISWYTLCCTGTLMSYYYACGEIFVWNFD